MNTIKRVLATLLMLVMLMQPFATAASVTEFLDFPNDWSKEAMTAAVENGLLIGNGNKLIEPGRDLKRSELAAIITRAFGATITADIGHFDDVKPGDWYYNNVSKAVQMGAMNGTSSSTFQPEESITREEVFTVLARVLCLETKDHSSVKKFTDYEDISFWALDAVSGLVENGYIDGYPDGTLQPGGDITRAELAQMFHNLFKTYIDTAGYHTAVASEGSVIVRAPGAHLENVVINGDLIIADGVGNGNFDLNTVTVNGRILARGGEGTVTFKKVVATDKVIIYDGNGIVNFHNYRTDVPFRDNLIEYTKATFLKKQEYTSGGTTGGGSGGSSSVYYTVSFYWNYDQNGDGINDDKHSTRTVKSGNSVIEPSIIREGYDFLYWSENPNDDGTGAGRYDFSNAVYDNMNLYAVFVPEVYTVTFDVEGETTTVNVEYGKTVAQPSNPTAPVGKKFLHWSTTKDGAAYDFATQVTGPLTLYAVFVPEVYTVTFDVEGETTTVDVEYGKTVAQPTNPTEPEGKDFSHWSTTKDGAAYDFTTPVTSSFTLYAVFVPVTDEMFDVIFKVDGTEVHSEEVTDGGYANGPATTPEDTQTTYFVGWIVEGDTTETVVDLAIYAINEDTTFVALFKNKLVVNFHENTFSGPIFTVYVKSGEYLTEENQYPHHVDNNGSDILDFGVLGEGFIRAPYINSVYTEENIHKIPMSYWYIANDGDTEWTKFDSSVEIISDTNVYINIKQVSIQLYAENVISGLGLDLSANYDDNTRIIDTIKDILFINEDNILSAADEIDDKIFDKLINRGLIDEDKNIKNIHREIKLVDVLGEDKIKELIWDFVGNNASDEDVEKDKKQKAYVNQLIDELCAGVNITVTDDRYFMFKPILEKLEQFNYEFVESKIPAKLKEFLPMAKIKELFERFYSDIPLGYVTKLRTAVDNANANPGVEFTAPSGVLFKINPIEDLFTPALEHSIAMKGLAEGKLADKFPTYYSYYKENPYVEPLESYLTTETWLNGDKNGFEAANSGYSLKSFKEYYQLLKEISVLADDAVLYYYNADESVREDVLEVAFTKMFDIANIIKGLLVDYAENGIPENLEDLIKSMEKDPALVEYLEKFGLDAYLDKISGNATADKVYNTAFEKIMAKLGSRIESLLVKFAESTLNRDYDSEEYNKALEIMDGLFADPAEEVFTVDTMFNKFLGGIDEKIVEKKDMEVRVVRKFFVDIAKAKK